MPRYAYQAKAGPKQMVEGILEAGSREEAVTRLTEQGYVPVRVIPAQEGRARTPGVPAPSIRVRDREITLLTRQLAGLFRSNIPVLRALELIRGQAQRPALRELMGRITQSVREGQRLSEAFSRFPALFPPLYVSLIRAGEVSGKMDEMLFRLVKHRENQEALREKVQLATAYPLFLLAVGLATILVLLIVVIPRLSMLFQDFQQALPWPTRAVIAASRFLGRTGWGWLGGIALGWALFTRQAGPGRALLDRLQLLLPFWRRMTEDVEVAHFCRTLGVLLESGVPILQAVKASVPTVENQVIRGRLGLVEQKLAGGTPLSRCLERVPGFSPLLLGVLAVGEESGNLSQHLIEAADSLESEVERSLKVATTLLEPALILGLSVVIGIVVAAMLLPIFQIGSGMTLE